jgi:hypothetical protein
MYHRGLFLRDCILFFIFELVPYTRHFEERTPGSRMEAEARLGVCANTAGLFIFGKFSLLFALGLAWANFILW